MAAKKHFLQDRTTLLLSSGNVLLAFIAVVLTLLKLGASQGSTNYIVSYRANLGIDKYTTGTVWDIAGFIGFALVICALSIILAYRTYPLKRELSLVILGLTIALLAFLIVVANALLVLR